MHISDYHLIVFKELLSFLVPFLCWSDCFLVVCCLCGFLHLDLLAIPSTRSIQTTLGDNHSGLHVEFHLWLYLPSLTFSWKADSGIHLLIPPWEEFLIISVRTFNIFTSMLHWLINVGKVFLAEEHLLKGSLQISSWHQITSLKDFHSALTYQCCWQCLWYCPLLCYSAIKVASDK